MGRFVKNGGDICFDFSENFERYTKKQGKGEIRQNVYFRQKIVYGLCNVYKPKKEKANFTYNCGKIEDKIDGRFVRMGAERICKSLQMIERRLRRERGVRR